MKKFLFFALAVVLAAIISGCAEPLGVRSSKQASLVYGYLDMSEASSGVSYFDFKQVLPKTDEPYHHAWVSDGVFYDSLEPGSYSVDGFGGMSGLNIGCCNFGGERCIYTFGSQDNGFRLKYATMYFMGSYKVKESGGWFQESKFEVVPVNSPTETEVLEKILANTEKGSEWEKYIKWKLEQLRKAGKK